MKDLLQSIPHETTVQMWVAAIIISALLIFAATTIILLVKYRKVSKKNKDIERAYLQRLNRDLELCRENEKLSEQCGKFRKRCENINGMEMQLKSITARLRKATDENRRLALKSALKLIQAGGSFTKNDFENIYKTAHKFLSGK